MTRDKHKMLRNIIVAIGIIGGFVLWIFIPSTFENNWLIHVGNNQYGSKWGLLLSLAIPLFALHEQDIAVHSDEEELERKVLTQAARKEMILAIFCSGSTLLVMLVTLLNTYT